MQIVLVPELISLSWSAQSFEPRTAEQLVGPDGKPRRPNWDHCQREMRGVNEFNEPM